MSTPLLQASGLALPDRLKPSGIEAAPGELICLIGPNGSGKTSLLHAIGGIGRPAGKVRIDGADPTTTGPDARRRLLAYLPASRDIAWPLIGRDLIALGLPRKTDDEALEAVIAELDLGSYVDRRIDRLSTGERSRVLIARALVAGPKLLLLDEPVANLDPLWQLRLMDHLKLLTRRNGQVTLIALHDIELARLYADRLIVMDSGEIAADGEPEALLEGKLIPAVFGIERVGGGWRPVSPPADPRSSR